MRFTVPGRHQPWLRSGGHGTKRFTRKECAAYKRRVIFAAMQAGIDAIPRGVPIKMSVTTYYPCKRPLKRSLRPAERKATLPDVDNLAKIVMDALNGIAYFDDGQVCDLRVRKWYAAQGDAARVEVEVVGA